MSTINTCARFNALLAAAALTLFAPAWGAADETVPVDEPAVHATPAPLMFQNREVFVFRARLLGYGPADRAEGAKARLETAARRGGSEEVTTGAIAEGTVVQVGGAAILVIAPGDVNTLAGETLESTVESTVAAVRRAMEETREQRDVRRLSVAGVAVVAATLIYAALLLGLVRGTRWLGAKLSSWSRTLAEQVKLGEHRPLNPSTTIKLVARGVRLLGWAVALILTFVWLTFALERFPYTRPWGEQLQTHLLQLGRRIGAAIFEAIPGLVFVVVILVLTRVLVRAVSLFLRRVESGKIEVGWLDRDTAVSTRRISTAVLWLFALAMAYPYLPGASSDAFKGLTVLVGLMVSIGASGIVGQAVGGLILTYSRTLRTGEYVRIGDAEGTVTELGIFATRIETGLGEEIVLPNALVVSTPTKNYSRVVQGTGFVIDSTVTIGYSTPWRQVHAMLLEAVRRTSGLLSEPSAFVVQTALSDFYVGYRLVAYAGPEAPKRRALVLSNLHANIQDVFNEHGVQIMSPHYMMDPALPQIVPPEKWFEPPARKPDAGVG